MAGRADYSPQRRRVRRGFTDTASELEFLFFILVVILILLYVVLHLDFFHTHAEATRVSFGHFAQGFLQGGSGSGREIFGRGLVALYVNEN